MRAAKFEIAVKRALLATTAGWLLTACGCAGVQPSNSGAPGGGVPGGGGGSTTVPVTASVSFCNAAQVNCQLQRANFSLTTSNIPDLNIIVAWENVASGTHSQEVRLLMPNGNLFQRLQNTFVVAKNGNGTAEVNRNIPIAGSFIAQRRMTGGWKVRVSLDGKVITTGDLRFDP